MRVKLIGVFCFSVLMVPLALPSWAQQGIDPRVLAYADTVLYNGKILTADDQFTIVEAVAIRDGEFLARGTTSDILRVAGPETRRIDLEGKTVVPGFIESHAHKWLGQSLKRGPEGSLSFATPEEGLEKLRQKVDRAPPGKVLQFLAPKSKAAFSLTRWDLDRVSPKNPVLLSFNTYTFNINSLALKMVLEHLEKSGLDAESIGVLKDPNTGEFTGQLRGLASGLLGYEILPWPDVKALEPTEVARLKEYLTEGTTMVIGRAPGAQITLLRNIWVRGELPVRVRLTHEFLRDNPHPEAYLKRMGSLTGLGDDWLKIIGTAVQQPDDVGHLTSYPKLRVDPGDPGGLYATNRWAKYSNAREAILLAARYGWNITSQHSKGDESVRTLLKAFDEASGGEPLSDRRRWVIDHNTNGMDDTVALMKKLEVIPSIFAWWGTDDTWDPERDPGVSGSGGGQPAGGRSRPASVKSEIYEYGADRLQGNWSQARSFIDAGLKPVIENLGEGPHVPLRHLQAFITRKDDATGVVWAPQEKVSRQEALWMKTRWVAYISGDENKLGSIEEGKLADLAVLDGDYLTVPEEEIEKLRVVMTVVDGKVVYERGN